MGGILCQKIAWNMLGKMNPFPESNLRIWSVSLLEEIYFQLRLSSGTNRSSELFLPLYKQTLQNEKGKWPLLNSKLAAHFPPTKEILVFAMLCAGGGD